jgi:hypothetical protein
LVNGWNDGLPDDLDAGDLILLRSDPCEMPGPEGNLFSRRSILREWTYVEYASRRLRRLARRDSAA